MTHEDDVLAHNEHFFEEVEEHLLAPSEAFHRQRAVAVHLDSVAAFGIGRVPLDVVLHVGEHLADGVNHDGFNLRRSLDFFEGFGCLLPLLYLQRGDLVRSVHTGDAAVIVEKHGVGRGTREG